MKTDNIEIKDYISFPCVTSEEENIAVNNYLIEKHGINLPIKETPLRYDGESFSPA